MHKRCIRVRLTVVVPSLETGRMPVINGLTFQIPLEQFQIPLPDGFTFSVVMNELYFPLPAYLFQKTADFLQVLNYFIIKNSIKERSVKSLYSRNTVSIEYGLTNKFFTIPSKNRLPFITLN